MSDEKVTHRATFEQRHLPPGFQVLLEFAQREGLVKDKEEDKDVQRRP